MGSTNPRLLATAIVAEARSLGLRVTTAESCTGGMVAAAITDVAGSSVVFDAGFVTYSNGAKARFLEVPQATLDTFGAVSREAAEAMAQGAARAAGAQLAVAITGIAGPGGGSEEKPVGLVHFACSSPEGTTHLERRFGDLGRETVRWRSTETALELLLERIRALAQAGAGSE